jgi:hypothetical protein
LRLLLAAGIAAVLHAASIRGTVVENQTSRPVARTAVQLQPIAGTPSQIVATRTNRFGVFEFSGIPAGTYILKATRRGFLPVEYGQKRWDSAGLPFPVQADEGLMLTIRLFRYGAISGAITDENEVGLPDYGIVVYRDVQPPQLVASGRSDERGLYRISGLQPGPYLVRSAAKQEDDEEYVPTFARETLRVEEARPIVVYPEDESRAADIHALPGKLFSVAGMALPIPPTAPVKVTLVSDMGRQTVEGPAFRFTALPPGPYELFAEVPENVNLNIRAQAAYLPLPLDRDNTSLRVPLQEIRDTRFVFEPEMRDPNTMQLLARRKDLAGTGPVEPLTLSNGRAKLAPGRWEVSLTPPPGYYVSSINASSMNPAPAARPDGWNELLPQGFAPVRFSLSSGGGALRGVIKSSGAPVVGAPVFIAAYDPATQKWLPDLRTTRTDLRGAYQFSNLPPGAYRALATFEYLNPDAGAFGRAGAQWFEVGARQVAQLDLDLYVLP